MDNEVIFLVVLCNVMIMFLNFFFVLFYNLPCDDKLSINFYLPKDRWKMRNNYILC